MGSPFEGLEFASEEALPGLTFPKREVDHEGRMSLQLEDKFLGAIERPATAPSPMPLLETINHSAFPETLLVSDHAGCQPVLHTNMVCLSLQ